jgi:hypothetical protein
MFPVARIASVSCSWVCVLVQRELESRGQGLREHRAAPCRVSRGRPPRRAIAKVPIPKGRSGSAFEGIRPSFGLGP